MFSLSDTDKFLYDYEHSKFIECNRKHAEESKKQMGKTYETGDIQNVKARHGLTYVKSVLEDFRKNYWLAAGTLLGTKSLHFIIKIA